MEKREQILADRIELALEEGGFDYERGPSIEGLRPDFLIHGPEGGKVVVEAKGWKSGQGNVARAREQASKYQDVTGADKALVVLWESERNYLKWGVITLDRLLPVLTQYFEQILPSAPRVSPERTSPERTVFAAMPFDRRYDDTFFVAMTHAAKQVDAACKRVDKEEFSGDIVSEITRLIQDSVAVIADLSESRPNVLFEAGLAHGLKKPTVHICATPLGELPFDVRNWNTLSYSLGQTTALRAPLASRLRGTMR